MHTLMLLAMQVLAEGGDAKPPGGAPGGSIFDMMPLFLGMALLFYFVLYRPAKRQQAEQQSMLGGLKKNDEVITSGGIIGTVVSIKKDKDEVVIDSGNTRLRVLKSSIARVVKVDGQAEEPVEEEKKEGES